MAFCANCGSPVEGPFCGKCGTRMSSPPSPQPQVSSPAEPPVYQPPPGGAGAAPPKKKRGPLFWVLTGCLGLVVIGGIIVVLLTMFVYQKAKQAGFDPALMQKNPGLAVAKMMAAVNPDIEILGVDEERGVIRVRNKKDGKTLTMDLSEAKKGKIVFLDEKGQRVELQAQGEGDKASLDIRGPEGSMRLGAGAAQLPAWLPAYPGAERAGDFGMESTKEGSAAMVALKSADSVEEVASFYENALKEAGLEVQRNAPESGEVITLTGADSSQQRTANVMIARTPEGTTIHITFENKQ